MAALRRLLPLALLVLAARQIAVELQVPREYVDLALVLVCVSVVLAWRMARAAEAEAFNRHFPVMRHGYLQQHIVMGALFRCLL